MDTNQDPQKRAGKPLIASTGLRQFMFLASHGLRNPLTAIRWSCGRLEKVEKHTMEAQQYLLQIAANTTRLTRILGAIFLLSRLQDQVQPLKIEELSLQKSLNESIPDEEDASVVAVYMQRDVMIRTDAEVLHSLFSCMFMACFVAYNGNAPKPIDVRVKELAGTIVVSCRAQAMLQLLRATRPEKFNAWKEADQLIGGTTGLLLTLSRDLAIAMGGNLKLEEADDSFTVTLTLPDGQS